MPAFLDWLLSRVKKTCKIGGTWTASCPVLLLLGTFYLGHILQYQWLAKSYRGSTISDPMPDHGLILDSHTCWKNTQGTVTCHWVCEIQNSSRLWKTNSGLWLLRATKCKAQNTSHPVLDLGYGKHSWSCSLDYDLVYSSAKTRI